MAFKTFAPGVLTSSDVNTFLMRQAVITCTSSTRPSSPSEGMTIYETDTDLTRQYSGSAWEIVAHIGAWQTYTPTLTRFTLGNGSMSAAWQRLGRMVAVDIQVTFGSTTAITGDAPLFSGPVTASSKYASYNACVGLARCYDASTTSPVGGQVLMGSSTFIPTVTETASAWGFLDVVKASVPFTWTTGDQLNMTAIYEAAS